jgi:hypothetical protein
MITLVLIAPGWWSSIFSRRQLSVWTDQRARRTWTRLSMYGTCCRLPFHAIEHNPRLWQSSETPTWKSGTTFPLETSGCSLIAWSDVVKPLLMQGEAITGIDTSSTKCNDRNSFSGLLLTFCNEMPLGVFNTCYQISSIPYWYMYHEYSFITWVNTFLSEIYVFCYVSGKLHTYNLVILIKFWVVIFMLHVDLSCMSI